MTGPLSSEPISLQKKENDLQLGVDYKQSFQNLRKFTQEIETDKGRAGLLNQVFAEQTWFLADFKLKFFGQKRVSVEEIIPVEVEAQSTSMNLENIAPTEMDQTLSAVEVFAQLQNSGPSSSINQSTSSLATSPLAPTSVFPNMDLSQVNENEILLYSSATGLFSKQKLSSINSTVDLLLIGSPELESHVQAVHDFNSEMWQLLCKIAKALSHDQNTIVFSLGFDIDAKNSVVEMNRFAQQLKLLRPKLVLSLGATASNLMLGHKDRLSIIHGKIFTRDFLFENNDSLNISFMPLYHPDFLLINPNMKRSTWEDMKSALQFISSKQN